jgi:hypothetical protein
MKQVVIENPVPKPVRPGDCLLSRMLPVGPRRLVSQGCNEPVQRTRRICRAAELRRLGTQDSGGVDGKTANGI